MYILYVYYSYYVLTWTISQITLKCIRPTTLPSTIFSGGLNSSCLLSISTSFAARTPFRPFAVYFSSVYLSSPQAVPSTSTFSLVITTFFRVSTTKWFDTSQSLSYSHFFQNTLTQVFSTRINIYECQCTLKTGEFRTSSL